MPVYDAQRNSLTNLRDAGGNLLARGWYTGGGSYDLVYQRRRLLGVAANGTLYQYSASADSWTTLGQITRGGSALGNVYSLRTFDDQLYLATYESSGQNANRLLSLDLDTLVATQVTAFSSTRGGNVRGDPVTELFVIGTNLYALKRRSVVGLLPTLDETIGAFDINALSSDSTFTFAGAATAGDVTYVGTDLRRWGVVMIANPPITQLWTGATIPAIRAMAAFDDELTAAGGLPNLSNVANSHLYAITDLGNNVPTFTQLGSSNLPAILEGLAWV